MRAPSAVACGVVQRNALLIKIEIRLQGPRHEILALCFGFFFPTACHSSRFAELTGFRICSCEHAKNCKVAIPRSPMRVPGEELALRPRRELLAVPMWQDPGEADLIYFVRL